MGKHAPRPFLPVLTYLYHMRNVDSSMYLSRDSGHFPRHSPVLTDCYRYSPIRFVWKAHADCIAVVHTSCYRHAAQSKQAMGAICRLTENFSSADGILLNVCAVLRYAKTCLIFALFAACQNKQRTGLRSHCLATKVLVILSSDRCGSRTLPRGRRARRPDMRDRV